MAAIKRLIQNVHNVMVCWYACTLIDCYWQWRHQNFFVGALRGKWIPGVGENLKMADSWPFFHLTRGSPGGRGKAFDWWGKCPMPGLEKMFISGELGLQKWRFLSKIYFSLQDFAPNNKISGQPGGQVTQFFLACLMPPSPTLVPPLVNESKNLSCFAYDRCSDREFGRSKETWQTAKKWCIQPSMYISTRGEDRHGFKVFLGLYHRTYRKQLISWSTTLSSSG